MDELSSARATAPAPRGATAKVGRSSGGSGGANVAEAGHAEGWGRATREPRVARQEDAGDVGTVGMDQRRPGLEQRENKATAVAQAQRAVGVDRVNAETDLVQVRDDHNGTATLTGADPEIAGRVGLGANPTGEQALHRGSDRRFHA